MRSSITSIYFVVPDFMGRRILISYFMAILTTTAWHFAIPYNCWSDFFSYALTPASTPASVVTHFQPQYYSGLMNIDQLTAPLSKPHSHSSLTTIIARKRRKLSRHSMLPIPQPRRIILLIMTSPPRIPLLHNHLLRRRHPMTPPITPRTRPRTLTCITLLQLIPGLKTKIENLPLNTST
jgi:hypothetical protein